MTTTSPSSLCIRQNNSKSIPWFCRGCNSSLTLSYVSCDWVPILPCKRINQTFTILSYLDNVPSYSLKWYTVNPVLLFKPLTNGINYIACNTQVVVLDRVNICNDWWYSGKISCLVYTRFRSILVSLTSWQKRDKAKPYQLEM